MSHEPEYQTEQARIESGKQLDQRYADVMARHFNNPVEIVQNYGLYIKRHVTLSRILHHYEIFRQIKDLPGSIVECGVFRGETLLLWGKFLEIFCTGDRTKYVYGFDHFQGLKDLKSQDGTQNVAMHEGAYDPSNYYQELLELIELFDADRFVPNKPRIKLVEGDVLTTIPKFVEQNPGMRISLLHLDLDLYEPTLIALQCLYPLVVKGGAIVFDEYAFENFPGETKAVEDYFGDNLPRIQKFDWFGNPGGFFFK